MNNDLKNNHSSKSSNRFIANKTNPQPNKSLGKRNLKNRKKPTSNINFPPNKTFLKQDRRPSNSLLLISKRITSEYPINHDPGPIPKKESENQRYDLSPEEDDPKHNRIKTYDIPLKERDKELIDDTQKRINSEIIGEDIEDEFESEGDYKEEPIMEKENENENDFVDMSPIKPSRQNNNYIGDGNVRNNKPITNNQNIRYTNDKNNLDQVDENENENQNEDENEKQAEKKTLNLPAKNNYKRRPTYIIRNILANTQDSAGFDPDYIFKSRSPDNYSQLYIKPKSKYNPNYRSYRRYNSILVDNDIGGKVDLHNYARLMGRVKNTKYDNKKNELDDDTIKYIRIFQAKVRERLNKKNKVTKIQSIWRGRGTRKIMKLYHDLEEFILLISIVNFNHYSDNFFFFMDRLFKVYKAKTEHNQIEKPDKNKKEDNQKDEEDKIKYDKLLNYVNDLQEKYNDLVNDDNDLSSVKKKETGNDIISAPGSTAVGTIKRDNNKIHKSKPKNDNLTFDDNDDDTGNNKDNFRRFSTPRKDDESSFNSKDPKFSSSDLRSEGSSQFFDNEQPIKGTSVGFRNLSSKNRTIRRPRIALVSLNKKNDRMPSYSPFDRGNNNNRNMQDSQYDNRINLSIVPKHEDEFEIFPKEKELDFDPKQLENDIYDKYANDFSKDLVIVKKDKINLKNPKDKTLYCFDNESMYPENENNLELVAPRKSDEQKIKDIFSNKTLFEKMQNKMNKMNKIVKPEKKRLVQYYGDSISLKSNKNLDDDLARNRKNIKSEIDKSIKFKILQNDHRNFAPSKLNLEFNELFLGEDPDLIRRRKAQNFVPIFEKEIKIRNIKRLTNARSFSKDKTLPTFNNRRQDNNSFTIKNKTPDRSRKPLRFPKEKCIIDSVYNTDFSLMVSSPYSSQPGSQKKIIYIPSLNVFKRLRRSKRTKDMYFTIKGEPIKNKNRDLSKSKENNFLIKNAYYYIETNDDDEKVSPDIIERKVTKTIFVEKPSERFRDDKMRLSNENFDIKADKNKNKYLEDIETNELMIPSEIKYRNKNNNNNNIQKRWEDLNPIAYDDFSFRNELDNDYDYPYYNRDQISEDKDEYVSLDINYEQFEIISNKKDRQNKFVESKQNTIKLRGKLLLKEDKDVQADIRPMKTTLRRLLKEPEYFEEYQNYFGDSFTIYGKPKKYDDRLRLPKAIRLTKNKNCQFNILKPIKELKDNGTETNLKPVKEFDNIQLMMNDDFAIRRLEKLKRNQGTETTDELDKYEKRRKARLLRNVKSEDINIRGIKKEMVESQTQMDRVMNKNEICINDEFRFYPTKKRIRNIVSKGDNLDIYAPKKEVILNPSRIENINLVSRNRAFPKLYMNNFLTETYKGEPKPILDDIKIEPLPLKPKKKKQKYLIEFSDVFLIRGIPREREIEPERKIKSFNDIDLDIEFEDFSYFGKKKEEEKKPKIVMKDSSTQMDDDKTNLIPDKKESFRFKPKPKEYLNQLKAKKKNTIVKPEQFLIEGLDRNVGLEEDYLEDFNFGPTQKKRFSNLYMGNFQDEMFKGKEKEKEQEKKKEKEKIILKLINNEPIELSGKEKEEILEFIRNEPIELNGIEKEDILEYIKNDSFAFRGQKEEKPRLLFIPNDSIELEGEEKDLSFDQIKNEPIELLGEEKEESEEKEEKEEPSLVSFFNEPIELLGEEKEPEILDPISKDKIMLNANERPQLKRIKNKPIILKGNEIGKDLEREKSEDITIRGKKKRRPTKKNVGTVIDRDLNRFLVHKRNAKFTIKRSRPSRPKRKKYVITTNDQFTIKKIKKKPPPPPKKKKLKLKLERQKSLNIKCNNKSKNKEFDQDELEECNSGNLIIPKETYDKDEKPENDNNLIEPIDVIELKGKDEEDSEKEKPKTDDKDKDKDKDKKKKPKKDTGKKPKNKKDAKDKPKDDDDDKNKLSLVKKDEIKLLGKDKKEKKIDLLLDEEPQDHFSIIKKKKKIKEKKPDTKFDPKKTRKIRSDVFSLIAKPKEEKKKPKKEKEKEKKKPKKEKDEKPKVKDEKPKVKEDEEKPKEKKPKKTPFDNLENAYENEFSILAPEKENKPKDKLDDKKKEDVTTVDVATQTPKLRPANKDPKKVVFHDIQTIVKREDAPLNEKEESNDKKNK